MTNLVYAKPLDDPASPYSAPAAVMVDSGITPSSPNQVRSLVVSRAGNDIVLRWTLGQANGKKTHVYFRRADSGVTAQMTPLALASSVSTFVVPTQALVGVAGTFFTRQVNADQSLTGESRGTSNPLAESGSAGPGGETSPALTNRYHHRDHLGNLRIVTDQFGALAHDEFARPERHDFYPFGVEMVPAGSVLATGSRKKFTGHERDEETGLDYMLARYHAPAVGRFLSVDPGLDISNENPQTWNLYGYVHNNPLSLNDPTGRASEQLQFTKSVGDSKDPTSLTNAAYEATQRFGEQITDYCATAVAVVAQAAGQTPEALTACMAASSSPMVVTFNPVPSTNINGGPVCADAVPRGNANITIYPEGAAGVTGPSNNCPEGPVLLVHERAHNCVGASEDLANALASACGSKLAQSEQVKDARKQAGSQTGNGVADSGR